MSWLYSRALAEEYLADTCLDGAPFAPSSETPTPRAYCSPDKMTDVSRLSRFGMTFAPLTDDRGEDLLTWYREDFLAKILVSPGAEPELMEPGLGFGLKCLGLLARFDPDSRSWRTPQLSLIEEEPELLQTLPRWGTAADGELWELRMLEPPTSESAYGLLLPTPTANELRQQGPSQVNRRSPSLACRVRFGALWPTPQASDNRQRATQYSTERRARIGKQISLEAAVKFWPAPTARNAKKGGYAAEHLRKTPTLGVSAGGALNPTWVEWLMGWPLGWTDFEPLGMDKFQRWQNGHFDVSSVAPCDSGPAAVD